MSIINIKPIAFATPEAAASAELARRFEPVAAELTEAFAQRGSGQKGPTAPPELIAAVREFFQAFAKLDLEYGESGPLPLEDVAELSDYSIRCLSELRNWCERLGTATLAAEIDKLLIGTALWSANHECELTTLEPLVNALANTANEAVSRQELAAVYGLMQGIIGAIPMIVKGDLEKSNPQRPWRVLVLNFAIVAVRTQDIPMMLHAFGVLGKFLPEEAPGFYAEAVAKANHAAFSDEVRGLLMAELERWQTRH